MRVEKFDVVIVGAGLSGLRAGVELSQKHRVAIISKVHPVRSHSGAAQGGINAALGNHEHGKDDTPGRHAFDTVYGSDYLADQDAVMQLCVDAPETVIELEHMGAPFSRLDSGRIAQRPFGGAGFPRTCYAGDRTGHALLHTLYEQCVRYNLRFFDEYLLIDLVTIDNSVTGVLTSDISSGDLVIFRASTVILATGGFGRIYKHSTNALINTGDGVGAAFRAGVPMQDCEFVQFHPTTLFGTNILITEGARGEGGYLTNKNNDRFMERKAPKAKELAPRDIVARAIETEIREGRGFEDGYVHLDLMHLGERKIKERLPGIREICINFAGIDPVRSPIPVQPAQHYCMGGIASRPDGKFCETQLNGLFTIGETSCISIHGANRLGGNSLLETVVFGRYIASTLLKSGIQKPQPLSDVREAEDQAVKVIKNLFEDWKKNVGKKPVEIRDAMKSILDENVGIFRKKDGLKEAVIDLHRLQKEFRTVSVPMNSGPFNYSLVRALELRNMLDIAEVTAFAALWRKESRGAHYRTDYPSRNDRDYLTHSLVFRNGDGLKLITKPVKLGIFPVKERKY